MQSLPLPACRLGDIALPGLFLAFALAFDKYLEEVQHGLHHRHSSHDKKENEDLAVLKGEGGGGSSGGGGVEHRAEQGEDEGSDVTDVLLPVGIELSSQKASSSRGETKDEERGMVGEQVEGSIPTLSGGSATLTSPAYFPRARVGYVVGLVCSILASQVFGAAQPALLYLVPSVLLPIILRGARKSHLKLLWDGFSFDVDDDLPLTSGSSHLH